MSKKQKQRSNLIFLGCNYSNKKIKSYFNGLKKRWEKNWPIHVEIIDKQKGKGSSDLWQEITAAVFDSALSIFDVSAYRPNVILELGYALAVKDPEVVVITVDERAKRSKQKRKRKSKQHKWELSDIGHLKHYSYRTTKILEKHLNEHLQKVPIIRRYNEFIAALKTETTAPEKYRDAALRALNEIRTKGKLSTQQMDGILKGDSIRLDKVKKLLRKYKVAKRTQGKSGWWTLDENI